MTLYLSHNFIPTPGVNSVNSEVSTCRMYATGLIQESSRDFTINPVPSHEPFFHELAHYQLHKSQYLTHDGRLTGFGMITGSEKKCASAYSAFGIRLKLVLELTEITHPLTETTTVRNQGFRPCTFFIDSGNRKDQLASL